MMRHLFFANNIYSCREKSDIDLKMIKIGRNEVHFQISFDSFCYVHEKSCKIFRNLRKKKKKKERKKWLYIRKPLGKIPQEVA